MSILFIILFFKRIKLFLFGERAEGYRIPRPSFRSLEPSNRPPLNQWVSEFNFGSRYGTRGSFYQYR